MSPERFDYLLRQFKADALTREQWDELRAALSSGEFEGRMSEDFRGMLGSGKLHPSWSEATADTLWSRIREQANLPKIPESPVVEFRKSGRRIWWAAAAAVTLLIGASTYFYLRPAAEKQSFPIAKIQNPAFKNDVLPGTNKAVLTLAGGKTIVLDSAATGLLAQQGTAQIQNQNGELRYITAKANSGSPASGNTTDAKIIYNSLTTARGQQFPLTLSDGTRVWLNASSSIRYPVAFNAGDRTVEITGEAYFEVVHDAAHPFHVKVNGMDVEDIGTHFNINAYQNEVAIKTTLLEGAISINNKQILKPGQQAQIENANQSTNNAEIRVVNDADAEGAIAWKNGQFHFTKVDITTIMRQIERWYDLEIIYSGEKTSDKFTGDIPRTATLTELLSILQMARVHFKLEGNKLTVMP